MDPERCEAATKVCRLSLVFVLTVAMVTGAPVIVSAGASGPSLEPIAGDPEAPLTRAQADAKIQRLLQDIETAIASGHMVTPSTGSAVEMFSAALAVLPLASPQGVNLMEGFPVVLRQRADAEIAGQHPETSVHFMVFASLVSSVLSPTNQLSQTDTAEAAAAPPEAARPSGNSNVRLSPPPQSGAATPVQTTPASELAKPDQGSPANSTQPPRLTAGPADAGGMPKPAQLATAAAVSQTPSSGDARRTMKGAEEGEPIATTSTQSPHRVPMDTAELPRSVGLGSADHESRSDIAGAAAAPPAAVGSSESSSASLNPPPQSGAATPLPTTPAGELAKPDQRSRANSTQPPRLTAGPADAGGMPKPAQLATAAAVSQTPSSGDARRTMKGAEEGEPIATTSTQSPHRVPMDTAELPRSVGLGSADHESRSDIAGAAAAPPAAVGSSESSSSASLNPPPQSGAATPSPTTPASEFTKLEYPGPANSTQALPVAPDTGGMPKPQQFAAAATVSQTRSPGHVQGAMNSTQEAKPVATTSAQSRHRVRMDTPELSGSAGLAPLGLASEDYGSRIDTAEATAPPATAEPSGNDTPLSSRPRSGTEKTAPRVTAATSLPASTMPASESAKVNFTQAPPVVARSPDAGGMPRPSQFAGAAAVSQDPSPSRVEGTTKNGERVKPVATTSAQSSHPISMDTAELPRSPGAESLQVKPQPQSPNRKPPATLAEASINRGLAAEPGPKIENTIAELRVQDAEAPVPTLPQPNETASWVRDAPATHFVAHAAARAPVAAPERPSPPVKLALARPAASMPPPPVTKLPANSNHATGVSPAFVQGLVQRGDALISLGDISGARRFYELAAEDGDGQAAKRLGDTYNPQFLSEHNVQGLQPDLKTAEAWYRKAVALGNPDASEILHYLISSRR